MASSSETSITNLNIHKVPSYQLWKDQYGVGIGVNDIVIIPPIELQPKISANGILKGNGSGTITAAVAGTDYQAPLSFGSSTTTFLRNDGSWGTPAGTYSLPLAANGTRGGVQIGYSSSGKNYAVQLSSEKMYVNVPWENTTYSLSGALSSHKFTSTLTAGGSGSGTSTSDFTLAAGTGITITDTANSRTMTIACSITNTDTKVTQSSSTTANWRKLLLHYKDDTTSTTAVTSSTEQVYAAVGISAQASTGTLRASVYNVADKVQLQWNATTEALDFVFI